MTNYYHTDTTTLNNPTEAEITEMYARGYVLTRLAKWQMNQTRSFRINLEKFNLYTKNLRILRKNENLEIVVKKLPLEDYSWEIHKLGKDFYTQKFGDKIMSASKVKEMFNDMEKSNMTHTFRYELKCQNSNVKTESSSTYLSTSDQKKEINTENCELITENLPITSNLKSKTYVGYCLAYINSEIVHYAYPFYNLTIGYEQHLGIGMMLKAILWAKENGKKYVYLGSVTTPESRYKLQFRGGEWFDTQKGEWSEDLGKLKEILDSLD